MTFSAGVTREIGIDLVRRSSDAFDPKKTGSQNTITPLAVVRMSWASAVRRVRDADSFQRVLEAALAENPESQIIVKTHPEVIAGEKQGYLTRCWCHPRVHLIADDADAYIEAHGALNGLMICAEQFPRWENLEGAISHLKFVRDHHHQISKVAFVSDSDALVILPKLASDFVSAEVKRFKRDEENEALAWVTGWCRTAESWEHMPIAFLVQDEGRSVEFGIGGFGPPQPS